MASGVASSRISILGNGLAKIRRQPVSFLRSFSTSPSRSQSNGSSQEKPKIQQSKTNSDSVPSLKNGTASKNSSLTDWADNPDFNISKFSDLPSRTFGYNQHMLINDEFKEALRQILWKFKAPIRYAFAYGSGVFPQGTGGSSSKPVHPSPNPVITKAQRGDSKMIDMIFGVSYSQHWHSLNLHEHRDHYSALGSLGSAFVSKVQDKYGAGVYFHPYITVNGTLIKYGVVNLDTLCTDLSEWRTLYLAGRLQKPVKILRDDPRVRLANQINLLSAVRTALLLLPAHFSEEQLYSTIAGISYTGDVRMSLAATENPHKVANIVANQLPHFRRLYAPLIDDLPNVRFEDARCVVDPEWRADPSANVRLAQDMDPVKRGNMVRRLPVRFRQELYFRYQEKFQIPRRDFLRMMEESSDEDAERIRRREGGTFEQRIASDDAKGLHENVRGVIGKTIAWPSTAQSMKSVFTAGMARTWRYAREKLEKGRQAKKSDGQRQKQAAATGSEEKSDDSAKQK